MDHDEPTAETLDIAQYAAHGFCPAYPLKRHRHETLANAGYHEAREDWAKYIGPACEFGGCNPLDGNFTAVVLPLCRPERLRLVAYILEYAFLHDSVIEDQYSESVITQSTGDDDFTLGKGESVIAKVKNRRKQIQAKMMYQLNATDKVCAARVMDAWKTMLSTTLRGKDKGFSNLEEYLDFRIIDTGAPFVESTMLFGMGMTLTLEEDALLADIIRPCYASLALANDYFSFDREWAEAQRKPGAAKPINAVWLYMRWRGVSPAVAKRLVREATNRYEAQFLELCDQFRRDHAPVSEKLDRYLRALSYQVSGNVVWSLRCPRYHSEFRYDPNVGLENSITAEKREKNADTDTDANFVGILCGASRQSSDSDMHSTSSWHRNHTSRSSSVSSMSETGDSAGDNSKQCLSLPAGECLGLEHLEAPFNYVRSLPSKGVRDTLADALNLWVRLPERTLTQIKEVVGDLHTASLMLDNIEDGSNLRRGHPAAHGVFGVPQTINSASFAIVEAIRKIHELSPPQLRDLHVGQSYDLHWTRHASCPTEEEYLEMVSKKTGGLFRLLSRLMCSQLCKEVALAIDDLVDQIGIYFQIRDDYENLNSDEYTKQKGFCEDLDEGKLSFPLVHHLNRAPRHVVLQVREISEQRRESGTGGLSDSHKRLVLQHLKDSRSVEYTRHTLKRLEEQDDRSISELERVTGWENWMLRLCLQRLSV
ncbi:terpenoid synthase [Parathielavia appendiculata]|uniref:Terpenoid synthase n=1 Tax=Parathielavia appendiculata TaxID=2587402 RepID=A0AAN6TTP5_9PEZI|nr:terpenoid synthase [Parathielavia appendiculata]